MRCVLLCMPEAVERRLCLLEDLKVPEELDVIRCVLLCTLEDVERMLCLLEVLKMLDVLKVLELMCCVLRATLEARRGQDFKSVWG